MSLSAFPQIVTEYDDSLHEYTNNVHSVGGMDLRDYFAAKAMQAFLSQLSNYKNEEDRQNFYSLVPASSYQIADAMMKARGE